MKKLIALLLAVLLCAALAACGQSPADSETEPATDIEVTEADTEDVESLLNEYLESANGQKMIESFKESAEKDGQCEASCYAQGNLCVFEAKLTVDVSADSKEEVKTGLQNYLDDENSSKSFSAIKSVMQSLIGSDDIGIKVVYSSKDGEILAEKIY